MARRNSVNDEIVEVLKVGLTTLYREKIIKDSISNGSTSNDAVIFADTFIKSPLGQDSLNKHIHEKKKEFENNPILTELAKNKGLKGIFRDVCVALIAGSIGALIVPFLWVIAAFAVNSSQQPHINPIDLKASELKQLLEKKSGVINGNVDESIK